MHTHSPHAYGMCVFLSQHGSAQLSATDEAGATPLDLAVMSEHVAAASAIKERGGVSTLRRHGGSHVHALAASGKPTGLRLLLSPETLEALDDAGLTPLHLACAHGQCATAAVLLEARADVNKAVRSTAESQPPPPPEAVVASAGSTPLHLACRGGDVALCELLLEGGASVAARLASSGEMPLHLSAASGVATAPQIATLLLQAGASLEECDAAGFTPLQHAVLSGAPALGLCGVLLEAGARPHTAEYLRKHTPLHRLCEHGGGGGRAALQVLGALVKHGAPLNAQDKQGNTPLHYCVFLGRESLALALTAAGGSLSVPNLEGLCPLSHRAPSAESIKHGAASTRAARAAMLARIAQPLPWLPDQLAAACQLCANAFHASNRRHHCRHCGRVVCSECSPAKLPILKFGLRQPQRCCADCAQVLALHGERPLAPPSADDEEEDPARLALKEDVAAHLDAQLLKTTAPPPPHPPPPHPPQSPQPHTPLLPHPAPTAEEAKSNPFGAGEANPFGAEAGAAPAPAGAAAATSPVTRALGDLFGGGTAPPPAHSNPFGEGTGEGEDGGTRSAPPTPPRPNNPFG